MRIFAAGIISFLVASLAVCPTQAQNSRLTSEMGVANIGSGGQLIPSGRIGASSRLVSYVDLVFDLRFSHLQTFGNPDFPQRGNFSYLDGSVGLSLHPVDTDRHRLDLGLSGAARKRWETRLVQADVTIGENGDLVPVEEVYEHRSSVDVGYMLRLGYSYKLSSKFRIGVQLHGYTYHEGTSLYIAGLTCGYLL